MKLVLANCEATTTKNLVSFTIIVFLITCLVSVAVQSCGWFALSKIPQDNRVIC